MISESMRGLLQSGSAIRRMWEEGLRLIGEYGAENVADLTLGNPVAPPPEELREALERVVRHPPADLHRYTPNAGHPVFRVAVAGSLDRRRILPGAREEHVVATCGASAAINVALRAILEPGDEVVLLAPYFPDYPAHVANHQGVPVVVPTDPDGIPDAERIYLALGRKTRALLVNHPNNPSGREYPAETLSRIADVLRERSRENGRPIWLISDEPYREIRYGTGPFTSPAALYEHGLIAYSWSKSLSLPGERIGYLAIHPECPDAEEAGAAFALANRILGFTNAPSLWQRVLALCVDACVEVAPYREKRDRLVAALEEKGYRVPPCEGTFYLFPETPGGDDEAYARRAMEKLLLVVPGVTFGRPGRFRMAFCVTDRTVDLAVERLPGA